MTCKACKRDHKPTVRCEVAARLAINEVRLTDESAINADVPKRTETGPCSTADSGVLVTPKVGVDAKTKNRRAREVYNAYMKRYMKEKRAGRKPLGIAHG